MRVLVVDDEKFVCDLLKKIERCGHTKLIHTIPSRGYKIGVSHSC